MERQIEQNPNSKGAILLKSNLKNLIQEGKQLKVDIDNKVKTLNEFERSQQSQFDEEIEFNTLREKYNKELTSEVFFE